MSDIEIKLASHLSAQKPIDVIIQRIKPIEAAQFIKGCQTIFDYVDSINPDLIFFPERGAGPINWTLTALGASDGRKYRGLPIPPWNAY